ncbi:MAG TPA: PEP-CTERM sorting domain-containing protein [Thermoplasmata archaeon]|jgi:hypothetical protein
MKRHSYAFLLFVMIPFCLPAAADTVRVAFVGPNGASQGGYYTDPYYGTVNGGPQIDIYCDDFLDEVAPGWDAYVSPIAVGGLGGAKFQQSSPHATFDLYSELAWLVTNIASHEDQASDITYAIWADADPGLRGGLDASAAWWLAETEGQTYGPGEFPGFVVLTPVVPGSSQEFLAVVDSPLPEPPSLMLLGAGLLGMGAMTRKKAKNSVL